MFQRDQAPPVKRSTRRVLTLALGILGCLSLAVVFVTTRGAAKSRIIPLKANDAQTNVYSLPAEMRESLDKTTALIDKFDRKRVQKPIKAGGVSFLNSKTVSAFVANLTVVALSDSHGQHAKLRIPPGDILIHAGDFTKSYVTSAVESFRDWISALPHTHKVVICGNHEGHPNDDTRDKVRESYLRIKSLFARETSVTVLHDSAANIAGINIYGSSWQPQWTGTGFHLPSNIAEEMWGKIPKDVDILVTHSPPYGKLDIDDKRRHVGDKVLMARVSQVQPVLHLFGHIHTGGGHRAMTEGATTFLNLAVCNDDYDVVNDIRVIKLRLEQGKRPRVISVK